VSIIDKKTGEIKESVSREVLKKQTAKAGILKTYLDYKLSQKESSTYGEKFLRHVNPTSQRVHSSYMQIMRTGRTSSTNPNCQNIKRGSIYRSAFQAEEGNTFVGADFSNIEARILADKCEDENFINIFINNGDYHLETAKLAFDNPNLTKGSEERQLAKTINFAIAFGAGAKKVSEGAGVTLAKGKELLHKVYTAFPKLNPYFIEMGNLTRERGYVVCNDVSKRRSYIPFYNEYLEAKKHYNYFKAMGWEPHPLIASAYKT
jgi:DNA polymerase-1